MIGLKLKPGVRVRIMNTEHPEAHQFLGKEGTIVRQHPFKQDGWFLSVDVCKFWWAGHKLQIVCCGAKCCMFHKNAK